MMNLITNRRCILSPQANCNWANIMVLNPAIIKDEKTERIHMLFRATGDYVPNPGLENMPLFPISLGYGYSDDEGETWTFDLDRPALWPKMEFEQQNIQIKNHKGDFVVNYANGSIEDPRLFYFEGACYMTCACRMFPPGAYWEVDEPAKFAPDWALREDGSAGKNYTVNVLYQVDLEKLSARDYDTAFVYITALTDPKYGEDRDVFFFPQRIEINGERKIVMFSRPYTPKEYPEFSLEKPSIILSYADRFDDFLATDIPRTVLATPFFPWENNRIGASAPPIKIGDGEWLLSYHGKQDETTGYTQSFMILKENDGGLPTITHRCPERVIYATEDWEQPNKFSTPCIFITGLIALKDQFLISYGAADEYVGTMQIDRDALIALVKKYPVSAV